MKIFVINCGSSSLKFQLIDSVTEECLAKGLPIKGKAFFNALREKLKED